MATPNPHAYWEKVYAEKDEDDLSWTQRTPVSSTPMIHRCGLSAADPIVDVGGGTSRLSNELRGLGYRDITVLDISEQALARTRERLGDRANEIEWIARDVTAWQPTRTYKLWHDRAVFHFLTDAEHRQSYLDALHAGVAADGFFIVATFAPDGPERCSGLPVQRYGAEDFAALLGENWVLEEAEREEHVTPGGRVQPFTWCRFRRA